MPRLDKQHKEYRLTVLGTVVYPGTKRGDHTYWQDTLLASADVLIEDGARGDAGASTACAWLTNWALDHLPAAYRARIDAKYLLRRAKIEAAKKVEQEYLDNTPAT